MKPENNVALNLYVESCLKFASDSKDWGGIDGYRHYSSDGSGGWYESCDNAQGGLDVSWAFHRGENEIIGNAPHAFIDFLLESVEQGIEEAFDDGQWSAVFNEFGGAWHG